MDASFDYVSRIIPETSTTFITPAAVAAATTWNPADGDAALTFSNGNLTVTNPVLSGNFLGCRATTSKSSGAWYFECHCDAMNGSNNLIFGIGDNTTAYTGSNDFPGFMDQSVGYRGGQNILTAAFTADDATTIGTPVDGDILMIAIDIDNKKIWHGINNTWVSGVTPVVNGTGQWAHWVAAITFFPMIGLSQGAGIQVTATGEFSAAKLNFSPPSGFSAWG